MMGQDFYPPSEYIRVAACKRWRSLRRDYGTAKIVFTPYLQSPQQTKFVEYMAEGTKGVRVLMRDFRLKDDYGVTVRWLMGFSRRRGVALLIVRPIYNISDEWG